MFRCLTSFLLAAAASSLPAAERTIDFGQFPVNQTPPGFTSALTGEGPPGDWRIVLDEVPPVLAPLSPKAAFGKRPVLAQLSDDKTDERFPVLIFNDEIFGDFKVTTRFKLVSGETEQMAGLAFRIHDENNYYVVRASGLGGTFRFYKFVNGQRSPPIGPRVEIPKGVWHELSVECKGNQIRCSLNGQELIPPLTDNSFTRGKIGFWTKSDSVAHFAGAHLIYTPHEPLAQAMVREMMRRYPRLLGLRVIGYDHSKELSVLGSSDESEIGNPGRETDAKVISNDESYVARSKQTMEVILPLRDRNGDPVAVLRVTLKRFPGQTEQNAVSRALPIKEQVEARVQDARDLIE